MTHAYLITDLFSEVYVYALDYFRLKSDYFSTLIDKNYNNPRILFNVINTVLNPVVSIHPTESVAICELFC